MHLLEGVRILEGVHLIEEIWQLFLKNPCICERNNLVVPKKGFCVKIGLEKK